MRRTLSAAAAGLVLAAGGAVMSPVVAPVAAAPRPTPRPAPKTPRATPSTPTLPVPRATVDPRLSIGGERLASMGVVVDLPAGVPAPPPLKDVSWVLADLDSGEVVAAKAAHARLLPASTLKTLTALTLIPRVEADRAYTATAADANADGTRVGILPGHTYTGRQLFSALLMSSGNDAAYALARVGGGVDQTLAAMNEQARHLGAHDTVAGDPSGLDAPGQTSSAYDLALIGRAAMTLPEFRAYVTTKQMTFPGRKGKNGKRGSFVIANHNRLLYNYEGTIGIKNGYTNAARRTFISAVSRGGKTYILTEMHGLDPSWRPQAAMYDWAFRYGDQARPVGTLVEPGTVTQPPTLAPHPAESTGAESTGADPTGADPTGAEPTGGESTRPASPAPPASADRGAAAAVPAALDEKGFSPWVGLGALAAAVLLVALLAARGITRAGRPPRSH